MRLMHALSIQRKDVVTLVGGGGKTALMFGLATDLTDAGWRVVTTMTTRIFVGQTTRAPAALILHDFDAMDAVDQQLSALLAAHSHVLVAGNVVIEQDKVSGPAPEVVDHIVSHPAVDVVIVEGDGSRRLPLKAPAAHEPVIPATTTLLIPMAGLDVIGRPLTPEYVHRPTLIAAITGAQPGETITPALIAAALAHPDGGAKGLPGTARLMPFLNKADDTVSLENGRETARSLLLRPQVDSVAIGALEGAEPMREVWTRVGAVVLAGGGAKRFGALKQLASWHNGSLVAHVTTQAVNCEDICRVVVTTGAGAPEVGAAVAGAAVAGAGVEIAFVEDWAIGQSRSVQTGLAVLLVGEPRLGAAIFLLADQPGVTPALIHALVQRHRETLAPVVAPRYRGQRGNPVLFDRATFGEFAGLSGDVGARPILQAHADEIAWVDWPSPEVIQDIDTPEDYRAADGIET